MLPSRKIVINSKYGGFNISDEGYEWLISKGIPVYLANEYYNSDDKSKYPKIFILNHENSYSFGKYSDNYFSEHRNDPLLIEMVETLKNKASGHCSKLEIYKIPKNSIAQIKEYDGKEDVELMYGDYY